jgi:3-oxoacyl-(acyl-carrier-protein) synthase
VSSPSRRRPSRRFESARCYVEPPAGPAPGGDLLDQVRAIWARILRVEVGPDDSFASLGGDSVQAVQIHAALERHLGRPLGPSSSTTAARRVRPPPCSAGERRAPVVAAAPEAAPAREPIAIVGAGLPLSRRRRSRRPVAPPRRRTRRLPRAARRSLGREPSPRPDVRAPGKTVCARGGFLDDVRGFEPAAFGLAARDAEPMDPQQRLFLEVAADALEALGGVHPSRIGVFAGSGWNEYFAELRRDPSLVRGATALGNLPNMVAARVAQVMGLTGPAITVDAACASSHVAIHLACASLRAGECDAAIAGAAQLNLSPVPFIAFSQSGVLSPSERCRPFAGRRRGFVPGEGAGAVVLKRLSRALADGDEILARWCAARP